MNKTQLIATKNKSKVSIKRNWNWIDIKIKNRFKYNRFLKIIRKLKNSMNSFKVKLNLEMILKVINLKNLIQALCLMLWHREH